MSPRVVSLSLIAGLLSLVAACGNPTDLPLDGVGSSDPLEEASSGVVCGGSRYDPTVVADAPRVSSLPDGAAAAADDAGIPAFDATQDWRVVHRSEDRVDLIRELDEPMDHGDGDIRTHESRIIERITGATNVPDGTWMLTSVGPCTQRLPHDEGLGEADVTLAHEPSPDDVSLDLSIHERACSSGNSAEGRIVVIDLTETTDEIRLHIGVRELSTSEGELTCEGNPATPYTVDLDEPVGERAIVDTGVVPARPLATDDTRP